MAQTETWLYNLVRSLPKDVVSHIVCHHKRNLEQFDLPNIHSFIDGPLWSQYYKRLSAKLGQSSYLDYRIDVARNQNADILHSHFGVTGWDDISVAHKTGLKQFVTFYGFDVSKYPKQFPVWRERFHELFDEVDMVLCEGPKMAESIVALSCPREKIRIQPLGIAVDQIHFNPRIWDSKGPLRVLIAGTFVEKKGISYALETLGFFKNELPLEITLIGDASYSYGSLTEKDRILSILESSDLLPITTIMGSVTHKIFLKEMDRHHIFLSPSVTADNGDSEGGLPVSILEAAATGTIVITTNHCDIPEIIQHRKTGLLTEEKDVNGLVGNLNWLINHPDEWYDFLNNARRLVETKFNASIQGISLSRCYRQVLGLPVDTEETGLTYERLQSSVDGW